MLAMPNALACVVRFVAVVVGLVDYLSTSLRPCTNLLLQQCSQEEVIGFVSTDSSADFANLNWRASLCPNYFPVWEEIICVHLGKKGVYGAQPSKIMSLTNFF
jgi:hypothetical protein